MSLSGLAFAVMLAGEQPLAMHNLLGDQQYSVWRAHVNIKHQERFPLKLAGTEQVHCADQIQIENSQ